MRSVLAALDASAVARPVMEAALALAELTGAEVRAVHVGGAGSSEVPKWLASRGGVPFKLLAGPVEGGLLDEMADPAVIAAVLGARGTPAGRRPAGRTALRILERARKPMLVVPPEAVGDPHHRFRHLLVPLEGTHASSRPISDGLIPLLRSDVELVVLHVFTAETAPKVLDRPARDLEMLGAEFLATQLPGAARIELHSGPVGATVARACERDGADLVVLSWSQDRSPGRAAVIHEVLGHSMLPVLLLPVHDFEDPGQERLPVEAGRAPGPGAGPDGW